MHCVVQQAVWACGAYLMGSSVCEMKLVPGSSSSCVSSMVAEDGRPRAVENRLVTWPSRPLAGSSSVASSWPSLQRQFEYRRQANPLVRA